MEIKTKCDIGETIFFKQGAEIIQAIISKIKIEIEIEKKEMTISYFTETDKENFIIEEHNIIGRAT